MGERTVIRGIGDGAVERFGDEHVYPILEVLEEAICVFDLTGSGDEVQCCDTGRD